MHPLRLRRIAAALALTLALLPGTCIRSKIDHHGRDPRFSIVAVPLPTPEERGDSLGPFQLERIWQIRGDRSLIGGYSGLLASGRGELLAVSDVSRYLLFSPPGGPRREPVVGVVFDKMPYPRNMFDTEAVTGNAGATQIWMAMEGENAIVRFSPTARRFRITGVAAPDRMADWATNSGPESMVRLADGRFIVLRESFFDPFSGGRSQGVLFRRDPVNGGRGIPFIAAGPKGFSATDMAQLPDGRVLVLYRRLLWPLPLRFAGRIAIGDPNDIRRDGTWRLREVAKLSSNLPIDNFEGIAIEPRTDGSVTVWIISDNNRSNTQRTLLWEMRVDPSALPAAPTRKKARG